MLSRLFIVALWSRAWKGLTSWLLFVIFSCVYVTFRCGILGQVWYFIVIFLLWSQYKTPVKYCPPKTGFWALYLPQDAAPNKHKD